uniref:BESS domain-containing protein n=1 Tax=Schizaphis graminum TaxID=13262 RepID=A0A2S2N8X0_SCHGA
MKVQKVKFFFIEEDCKKRWRNIRDTYMKQKKKLSTGSATSEKVNRTLSHLSFMDSVEYERKTTSNVEKQLADNSFSTTEDGGDGETLIDIENDEDTSLESTKISTDLPSSYGKKRIRSKEDKISQILAKRSKERDIILSKIQAQNEILVSSISNQQEDSVDLFFKSISTVVKKLPRHAINEAKLQILSLVNQLEDKYCNVQELPQVHQSQYYDYNFPLQQRFMAPSSTPTTSSSSHGFMQYNYEEDNTN